VDAFDNMCLRRILIRIPYTDHVSNATIRLQTGSPPQLSQLIQARQLRFLADRINGRAVATVLRLSSVVCLCRYVLWLNGAS